MLESMVELYETLVVFGGITLIVAISVTVPLVFKFKHSKMLEEHKTNNLALAYQILQARPELSLEDVQKLIEMSDGSTDPMLTKQG